MSEDHIDALSASLAERDRPQVAPHIRSVEVQTLDALLRIEEKLETLLSRLFDRVEVSGEPSDLITNIKPIDTPFSEKAVDTKAKKKPQGRQDRL